MIVFEDAESKRISGAIWVILTSGQLLNGTRVHFVPRIKELFKRLLETSRHA